MSASLTFLDYIFSWCCLAAVGAIVHRQVAQNGVCVFVCVSAVSGEEGSQAPQLQAKQLLSAFVLIKTPLAALL